MVEIVKLYHYTSMRNANSIANSGYLKANDSERGLAVFFTKVPPTVNKNVIAQNCWPGKTYKQMMRKMECCIELRVADLTLFNIRSDYRDVDAYPGNLRLDDSHVVNYKFIRVSDKQPLSLNNRGQLVGVVQAEENKSFRQNLNPLAFGSDTANSSEISTQISAQMWANRRSQPQNSSDVHHECTRVRARKARPNDNQGDRIQQQSPSLNITRMKAKPRNKPEKRLQRSGCNSSASSRSSSPQRPSFKDFGPRKKAMCHDHNDIKARSAEDLPSYIAQKTRQGRAKRPKKQRRRAARKASWTSAPDPVVAALLDDEDVEMTDLTADPNPNNNNNNNNSSDSTNDNNILERSIATSLVLEQALNDIERFL